MILVIDNHDSFVHNLARYIRQLGFETLTVRNDDSRLEHFRQLSPAAVVISPGPGTPEESGYSLPVVRKIIKERLAIPVIGVCLGHQVVVTAVGGQVIRGEPMHGMTSSVFHDGHAVFDDIPSPFTVGRYHSLIADPETFPDELAAIALTQSGEIMALIHRELKIYGVQFHPESVLTEHGYLLLGNILRLCVHRPAAGHDPAELQAGIMA